MDVNDPSHASAICDLVNDLTPPEITSEAETVDGWENLESIIEPRIRLLSERPREELDDEVEAEALYAVDVHWIGEVVLGASPYDTEDPRPREIEFWQSGQVCVTVCDGYVQAEWEEQPPSKVPYGHEIRAYPPGGGEIGAGGDGGATARARGSGAGLAPAGAS